MVRIQAPACFVCGTATLLDVTDAEHAAILSGTHIQSALPDWSPEDREVLISGTHPACWDALFPAEDEDE